MSDKLKQAITVVPEFTDGEQPPAAKFTAIGAQLRRASAELEKAVGDIHDESWPYKAETSTRLTTRWGKDRLTGEGLGVARPLNIANLARLIGPASNLNPAMLGQSDIVDAYPVVTHEFSLRYVPEVPELVEFPDEPLVFTTIKALHELKDAGDYHVTDEGKVYCVSPTVGGFAHYTVNPTGFGGGLNYTGARFNVIPDPNQAQTGLYKLSVVDQGEALGYLVTLPLASAQQSSIDGDQVGLRDYDINKGLQLKLPQVLVNSFSGPWTTEPGADLTIPEGFLFLRNNTRNLTYTKGVYTFVDETHVRVTKIDLTEALLEDDLFSIITVGTDITTSIDDLRTKQHHSHDRTFGEPFVPVESLSGTVSGWADNLWADQAPRSGVYMPSQIPGNYFPQYLHRDGYHVDNGDVDNLNDRNIMRGHLVIGSEYDNDSVLRVPGDYFSQAGTSYKLYFGSTNGTYLYKYYDNTVGSERDVFELHGDLSTFVHLYSQMGMLIESDNGSLRLDADSGDISLSAQSTVIDTLVVGGNIVLEADQRLELHADADIWAYGRLSIVPHETDVPSFAGRHAVHVHPGGGTAQVGQGHIGTRCGSFWAGGGAMLGPFHGSLDPLQEVDIYEPPTLTAWEIHDQWGVSGSGFATTTPNSLGVPQWVVPRFGVIHFAEQETKFYGRDAADAVYEQYVSGSEYWRFEKIIPEAASSNRTIGCTILVKPPSSDRWFGAGQFPERGGNGVGEEIGYWIDGNILNILITKEGNFDGNNGDNGYYDGNGSSIETDAGRAYASFDVKIVLFIAMYGDHLDDSPYT